MDGERYIERVENINTGGDELLLKTKLVGVQAKGSGATVEFEQLLCDKSGKIYYKMSNCSFLIGAKNFDNIGKIKSKNILLPNRAPDNVVEMPISTSQASIYRLSGDYNPLHVSTFKKTTLLYLSIFC